MIAAVIYDMDGILVDSEPLWRQAEIAAFAEAGINLTDEMCHQTTGLRIDEVVDYWFSRHGVSADKAKGVEDSIVEHMLRLYGQRAEPMAGVRESLAFWREKGVPLALASSSPMVMIDAVVDAFSIRENFKVLYSAEYEPYGKPHPGVYLTTLKKLGVEPSMAMAIEDSINGMIAAKAARMRVIGVPDPTLRGNRRLGIADVVLDSLNEVNEGLWATLNG